MYGYIDVAVTNLYAVETGGGMPKACRQCTTRDRQIFAIGVLPNGGGWRVDMSAEQYICTTTAKEEAGF